ncbi:MAG: MGMT family protein [Egibacteraceae bacterium]
MHQVLEALPPGRWTTYGDLAAVVGTGAQALGQHISICTECPNTHRVLGAEGRSRPNYRWSDPTDTRSQQDALEEEGVAFRGGVTETGRRLSPAHLNQLMVEC